MYFYKGHSEIKGHILNCMVPTCRLNTIAERSMMKTSFIRPCFPLNPPNTTALLSFTAVMWLLHGGGISPVVAGQLHTPAVKIEETIKQILINNAY